MRFGIIVIVFILLFGCEAQDAYYYSYSNDNIGDVFISCREIDSQLVYAPVFYTYSNKEMEKVQVYHEETPEIIFELDSLNELFTFASIPLKNSFVPFYPKPGNYVFEIEFVDGSSNVTFDYLDSFAIAPVLLNDMLYQPENNNVVISWGRIANADNYKVWLIDADEKIVYNSGLISSNSTEVAISVTSVGWYDNGRPEGENENYNIIIEAFSFEANASTSDIQAISTNDRHKFVWGLAE